MKGTRSVCFGPHCNHIFVYQVLIFVAINWTSSDPSVGADCSSHSSRNSTIRGHGGHLGALSVRSVPNVKGPNSFFHLCHGVSDHFWDDKNNLLSHLKLGWWRLEYLVWNMNWPHRLNLRARLSVLISWRVTENPWMKFPAGNNSFYVNWSKSDGGIMMVIRRLLIVVFVGVVSC